MHLLYKKAQTCSINGKENKGTLTDGKLEHEGGMVALEHCEVIVEHGERVARVAEEGAGGARVIQIVRSRRYECANLVQRLQQRLEALPLEVARHGLKV